MNSNYIKYRIFKPFKSWKNKYLKHISTKEAKKDNLYNLVAAEIGEYTKEPIDTVKKKFSLGLQSEGGFHIFTNQENISTEKVRDFYREADFYLYELPLWNAQRNRPGNLLKIILPYLKRNGYKRILDFGGGTGDLCIELAKNNLDVTYCEISKTSSEFAKWRFKRRNLEVKIIKTLTEVGKNYDCVVSFDVFEHVRELPELLKQINGILRKNGSMIFSGAFSGGTLHLEENEFYNEFKNLDKLMIDSGFYFMDKFARYYFYKLLFRTF
ncbi:MAG: class I SAM-dependent methyltransferase [Candidatus Omnitrophota bacterium]